MWRSGLADPLLAAIVAGDAAAFGRWVAGAEPRVRGSLRSFAAQVDTEAVVQETLLRVWQVAPRFVDDGRPDGLVRLAVRIARNLAISECRKRRATPTEDGLLQSVLDDQSETPAAPDPLLRTLIQRCLDALPASPRTALAQRIAAQGGASDHTLSAQAGMTLNTFLQNVRRARMGLQRCLEGQGWQMAAGEGP